MRWYHWICAYMIILPWLGLAILPESLMNNRTYTGIVLCVVLGVVGMKKLPARKERLTKGPPV